MPPPLALLLMLLLLLSFLFARVCAHGHTWPMRPANKPQKKKKKKKKNRERAARRVATGPTPTLPSADDDKPIIVPAVALRGRAVGG